MKKFKYLSLILMLSVLMFAQYEIPIENLLTNSGFGVWSQSDTNKGIAALIYDTGAAGGGDIPDVGDAVTGGASGATGKIMSMTINNTFAGGNAWGTIQLGSTTGCFNDDEALAFDDGETAVVNHPDGAVGADKIVKNGAFVHNIDPPWDWTPFASADLDTEAGGKVGNCLEINENGEANPKAYQIIANLTAGKIYKLNGYVKAGTEANYRIQIIDGDGGHGTLWGSGILNEGAGDWSTNFNHTLEIPSGTTWFYLYVETRSPAASGTTFYYDEITLYEITPGCTGVDNIALDTWYKDTTIDIYREHNGANTKDGSFYALKMVITAASDFVRWPGAFYANEEWYMRFQERTVTIGAWVNTSTANHAKLTLTDSAGSTSSSFHTGGGTFEWLETTRTIDGGVTSFAVYIYGDVAATIDGNTIIYVSQSMLSFQSSIGSGNYSPRQHEVVLLKKAITSNTLNNITSQSDLAVGDLNIEADSDAMLPKGCKAVKILTQCNDSASAGADCYLALRADVTKGYEYYNSPYGLANDTDNRIFGWIQCDSSGDIDRYLNASGANTFDLDVFYYVAVQVTN